METLTSADEITALTMDLPVYMLEHMAKPTADIVEGLVAFLDHRMSLPEDNDPHWDLKMGNALAVIVVAQHPDALALCIEMYNWIEDASLFLNHKILRLIETALTPAQHHQHARRWLKTFRRGHDLHLPLTLLAARSGSIDEELQMIILDYWKTEPLVGVQLMGASKNDVYLELLERELTWLAPFVRYIPLNETSPTNLIEHELWAEMSEAWFSIAHQNRPTPPWLNPAFVMDKSDDFNTYFIRHAEWQEHLDNYLMEKFGAELPWSSEEWIKKIEGSPEFNRWKTRFLEASQVNHVGKTSPRKGLRLVHSAE